MFFRSMARGRNSRRKLGSDESGQELVEGAMVLFIIFVFLFGIFEMGRLLQVRQALTDAAREGARRSVVPLTQTTQLASEDSVRDVVKGYLKAAHILIANSDITIQRGALISGSPTQYTRVTVRYPYHPMTLKIFGLNNVNITGSSLMRNETSP